jgi:hypothetical protein
MPCWINSADNDSEIDAVKKLCQQMNKLHQIDMDRNELNTSIVDTFFKESKVIELLTCTLCLNELFLP